MCIKVINSALSRISGIEPINNISNSFGVICVREKAKPLSSIRTTCEKKLIKRLQNILNTNKKVKYCDSIPNNKFEIESGRNNITKHVNDRKIKPGIIHILKSSGLSATS